MTTEHDRFVQQLASYALGSLDADQVASIEAHMRDCEMCRALLADYQAVTGTLPLALEPVPPPASAWSAIRSAARATRPAVGPRAWRWLGAAHWPAVAAIILALLGWNVTLQRELARRSPGPAPGPEVEALSRRPGRIVILQGAARPAASARIFVAVDGGGHLAVSGLAGLPPDRVYQLWFLRDRDTPVSGASFRPDPSGRAWAKVTVPDPLDEVRAIVVTEEPAPASPVPTGSALLSARPWR